MHKKNRLLSPLRHYPKAGLDYSRGLWISKVHKLLNKERNKSMRSLNLSITNISRSVGQFLNGNEIMINKSTLRTVLLASLIAMLPGLANAQSAAQSSGRWVGRIQLAPSTTSRSAERSVSARHDDEETTSQSEDRARDTKVSISGKKPTIVGSWVLTVSIPDNAPPFDSFKALWSLTGDGLLVSSAQGDVTPVPFPTTSSAYGAWVQTEGRQYAASFVAILYDVQTGENMGSLKLNQSITLSDSGVEWNGPFQAKVLDPDGNLIVTLNGTVNAKRITVEPLQ